MIRLNLYIRVEAKGALSGNIRLGLANVFLVEQKLPVQVTNIDGIQINLANIKKSEY